MPIAILDVILLLVMLISAFLAMIRGFVREILSIAAWVAAVAAAIFLYPLVLPYVTPYIDKVSIATGVTIAAIFLVALIIVSYITMRISDFVLDSRIGALDRSVGFAYGALRGLLLVVVAMMFLNWFLSEEQQPQWVTTAKSRPILLSIGTQIRNVLPEDTDSWLIDTLKDQIRPDEGGRAVEEPVEDKPPAGTQGRAGPGPNYDGTDRNSLDQLVHSSNSQ